MFNNFYLKFIVKLKTYQAMFISIFNVLPVTEITIFGGPIYCSG